ncbi:ComEC/Rec2 family competence protein [Blastococcus sp. BMG 814]|uniref:ComEC/Rec2 family competence protein n=1 Tax=Blastococcus carthaginiensis TaxID=3050034 RepID=A0ABT9IDN8_9ACTN|nr:ComEC/Rec2 family competence protein [Blastococcus carthaginiensis]MDP5183698.1 ComEC/Rec2 family competence protein [Blastococcus carthaginiensis]
MSTGPDRRRVLDLRLWPLAGAVWGTGLVAPLLRWSALALIAGAALGAAALLARTRGPAATVALVVLAGVAVGSGTAAVREAAREASPLQAAAEAGREAEVVLTVRGDPRVLAGGAGGPRVLLEADVTELLDGGTVHHLDDAVLVFADAEGWAGRLPGQQLRVRAGLGLPGVGDDVVAVLSARGPPEPVGGPGTVQRVAGDLRHSLGAASERVLDDRAGGLLPGLVVGDTSRMDPVLDEEFQRAGLAHLTAVSGANVAIVVAGVLRPLRRRAVDRRGQALVGGLALVGFVVLARPSASVLRAAAMGAVTLLALASGRPRAALPALGAAVTVLLLVEPGLARDPGFTLSVVATAAIVLLAPPWARRLRGHGWPAWPADAVAVSAAAGLATAPVLAGLTGTVSLVSLPANLLAAPAVPAATVLGLLAAPAGLVLPWAGDALVGLAGWPVRWIVLVAQRAAAAPDAVAGWPAGTVGALLLAVLLLGAGCLLWRFPRVRPLALAALVALVVVGWPLRQGLDGWPPDGALVVACDVGQGDGLVLPLGDGQGVLVDAGPDPAPIDRCLDRLGIDGLPLVLLSHLDADHVGGLAGALDGRTVGVVATGTLSPADDRAPGVDALVRRAGGTREVLVPGNRRSVAGVGVEVLAPDPRRATAAADPNGISLVARVTVGGLRLLLTGDIGADEEAALLRTGADLRADVLKVPHHGSGDADPDFLAATGARSALISVGTGNGYGHPAPRLLGWLADAGIRVHRTDRDGDLAVVGTAGDWGIAARGTDPGGQAAPPGSRLPDALPDALPSARAVATDRRCRVGPCGGACRPRRAHVAPPGGDRRGGAAALPRRRGRAPGGARPPPRRRGARAGRDGPAGRRAGRRAGAVPVRRSPARRRHRGAGGGHRAGRRPRRLRQGARPRSDAGRRALRRQAERGAGQGVQGRRCRGRRVPQGLLRRRPHRLRAQRGAPAGRSHHPRRRHGARRRDRRRPAVALGRGRAAGLRLRRQHRRRRRRPVPPRPGRGHRVHRGRARADR